MSLKNEKKFRNRFWKGFLILYGTYSLIIFIILNSVGFELILFLEILGLILFICAYIVGFKCGKEHTNDILDYMESGLRWKVRDAEQKMNEEADCEWRDKQQ